MFNDNKPSCDDAIHMNKRRGDLTQINETLQQTLVIE